MLIGISYPAPSYLHKEERRIEKVFCCQNIGRSRAWIMRFVHSADARNALSALSGRWYGSSFERFSRDERETQDVADEVRFMHRAPRIEWVVCRH